MTANCEQLMLFGRSARANFEKREFGMVLPSFSLAIAENGLLPFTAAIVMACFGVFFSFVICFYKAFWRFITCLSMQM